jgi:hypothetical protein
MSIIDQQKELEYYPDDVLAQEMMQPTGIAPSFLVATEIKRRNDMRNSYQMQMNQPPQMSVAEEQAMELQGIPNIDPNMMQQQMMQDPMMQEQMPQNAPMQMREGGAVRYQSGTQMTQDEADKIIAQLFNRERAMKKFPQYFNPDGSQKSPAQRRAEGSMDADKYLFGELYDQSMPRNESGQILQRRLGLEESNLPENVYENFSNIADEQIALRDALRETEQSEMIDPDGGYLAAGISGPMGGKIVGEGGWLYDPTSKIDNALLAASFIPIGGRAATALGLGGKAAVTGGKAAYTAGRAGIKEGLGSLRNKFSEKISKPIYERIGKFAGKERQLPGMVEAVIGKGFVPSYGGKASIPMQEVGRQAIKAFSNPFANPLKSPFYSRTLPSAFVGNAALSAISGEDNLEPSIGGSAEASTEDAITQDNIQSLQDALQQKRDNETTDQVLDEGVETGMETEAGKMLADAMASVPEDTTFQEYLDALQGMEATRQSQILMDLGASIANASHGGDIAKGFQEAGTKARTEQLNIAKERARVMGESRAMDIDIGLKIANIDRDLSNQTGRTLQELLALLQMNEDFITDNYPDSAEAIMQQIREAIRITLPPAPEEENNK